MGLSLSREHHAIFVVFLSFHSFVRAAPRAFFRPDRIFPSPSRGRAMVRGEPAIGRDQSREPRLYSLEPVWGPDQEAVIRFCGQGSEAAGPFSQRHCSHSRMRIVATSAPYRLPRASSVVRARTMFVFSRSKELLTPPAVARHRPAL